MRPARRIGPDGQSRTDLVVEITQTLRDANQFPYRGGCTLLIGVPMIGGSGSDLAGMVPMLLLFGGVPFLVGLGLWFLAVKVGR